MEILPIKTRILKAPKDDLLEAIYRSKLKLKDGDIVAISSKVVSIHEGNTVLLDSVDKRELIKQNSELFLEEPKNVHRTLFTISKGVLVGSAGIDESNSNGYWVLYPEDPFKSAKRLRGALMKHYKVKTLGVIITDSMSIPLRRGAVGFALAWDGFRPLNDYRKKKDLFGRAFKMELANMADGIAAGAVAFMGEGSERTPLAVVRGANVKFGSTKTKDPLMVQEADDIFAPLFFTGRRWKKGGRRQPRSRSIHV